jgi:undecaprenyl-diphosphatase
VNLRDSVDRFDDAAARALDSIRSPALDHVGYALGAAADHSLLWHAIGAVRAASTGDIKPALRLSGALGVESLLTNVVIKSMFRRVRPQSEVPRDTEAGTEALPYGMRVPITTSFPSGHAASAFLAATVLSDETGSLAWYALAALVATSRVYVRMHHASDVVAGAALGYALGRALRVAWPR